MTGLTKPSASLQIIQNCEEWLIHQMLVLPVRRTWTGWRNDLTGTFMKFNKGKCKFLPLGRNNPM